MKHSLNITDKIVIILGIIAVLLIIGYCLYVVNNASAGIPLTTDYRIKAVVTSGGVYQTGLAASTLLSIMRNSDHYWLDFDDNTFKSTGHVAKTTPLLEDTSNSDFKYYYHDWEIPATEVSPEIYSFFVKCTGVTKMYDARDISYDRTIFYSR